MHSMSQHLVTSIGTGACYMESRIKKILSVHTYNRLHDIVLLLSNHDCCTSWSLPVIPYSLHCPLLFTVVQAVSQVLPAGPRVCLYIIRSNHVYLLLIDVLCPELALLRISQETHAQFVPVPHWLQHCRHILHSEGGV